MKEELKKELLRDAQLAPSIDAERFRFTASDCESHKSVDFKLPDGSMLTISKVKYSYPEVVLGATRECGH